MSNGPAVHQPVVSWWNLSYWIPRSDVKSVSAQEPEQTTAASERGGAVTADNQVPASTSQVAVSREDHQASTDSTSLSGWDRIRALYEQPSMERDCSVRKRRMDYAIVRFAKSGFSMGMKAALISGSIVLTLAAVVHLYALSMDKSVDQAYWTFKREYESDMRSTREWEERVTELMKAEGYKWRGSAAQRLKKLDEEKIAAQDA
ncbi:hypothetical protein ANCDUO_01104 [Ancylostoma duodenale]|uniref:Uncharacterized protein n=1 Tax=Ancylostoma duodenale TaxID=51022 RepID=A0A0C2HA76_9BILA|nr:hypothetical protein ANCDUO_01104 [Ancylostoma duodenale]